MRTSHDMSTIMRSVQPLGLPNDVLLMLGYVAGLLASRAIGATPEGLALTELAAPMAIGIFLRLKIELEAIRLLALLSAAILVGWALGEQTPANLLRSVASVGEIAVSVALFRYMRRTNKLTSSMKLMSATLLIACLAPLAALPLEAMATTIEGRGIVLLAFVTLWLVKAIGIGLILTVFLAQGRERRLNEARPKLDPVERKPHRFEAAAAVALVAGLMGTAVMTGRPEIGLCASVALIWFALRFGLFAVACAAFCFGIAMLWLSNKGLWPAMFGAVEGPGQLALNYVFLWLTIAPSIVAATVVHEQMRLRRLYAYRAMHDGLTSLANRSHFVQALDAATAGARANRLRFVLLLIDLDHFKSVNDTYGHARGDRLLIELSNRLRRSVRATDLVARLGGDEFAVIAPVPTIEDAIALTKRLSEVVNQECDLDGATVRPSVTIGGVLAPDSCANAEQLMLLADGALYQAKASGRNCWRFADRDRDALSPVVWRPGGANAEFETVFLD